MKTSTINLTRRNFLVSAAASGVGISFGFAIPSAHASTAVGSPEVNAWVVIEPDDTIIIRIARSEMGQGTLTGLAQLVAEELDCDWDKVTTEYPTPGQSAARNRVWGSFGTGGSSGIRRSHDYVREGGAAAREMLITAAAKEWGVNAGECSASNSVITHKPSGKQTTYGKVATLAATMPAPSKIILRDPKDWKIAGKPLKRLDTLEKLNGKLVYGADINLPGMLNATIKACPVFEGKLKSYDDSDVIKMRGVKKVVSVGDNAVAVIADTWWRAKKALDALPIVWDEGPYKNNNSQIISDAQDEGLTSDKRVFVGNENGDFKAEISKAAKTVEGTYSYPNQNHATMEPMNTTALWTSQKCEIWSPTQNGENALKATAKAAGLPLEKCEVYKLPLGGGFGRRLFTDYIEQAVEIAKQMPGVPVKLLWSREEDMMHGAYHPTTKAKLVAGLNENGDIIALHARISGQSIREGRGGKIGEKGDQGQFSGFAESGDHAISYTLPNLLVDHAMRNPHVPPGYWRGVNINHNAIYLESFIDEIAHASGQDALDLRRKLMKNHPKNLAVLEAAAEQGGWGKNDGKFRGLCACKAFGSYIAACSEVSVSKDGNLKIERIVAATDTGHVVNPQQVEAQIQGSFVYGLSAMLYGEITIKDGHVEQENFDTYPSLLISEMPKVEAIIMPSGGFWGGVGEPTIAVAAPSVLNAIYNATGIRVRNLPLSKNSLKRA